MFFKGLGKYSRGEVIKQLSCVLEVGFGVGAGAGQTLEGLVQNRNNPLLFFERRERDGKALDASLVYGVKNRPSASFDRRLQPQEGIPKEIAIQSIFSPDRC